MKISPYNIILQSSLKRMKNQRKNGMNSISERERIEISRILESIEGKLDKRLIKLTMDVIMNTKWSQEVEENLYRKNKDMIPQKAVDAVLLGSHIGQIYQVSLDFTKKLKISLKPLQKSILREFIFFLVLIRTEREQNKP